MKKTILDRVIQYIREESGMMTSGSNPQGFSNAADSKGPVAGYDPVMGKMEKRKRPRYIWLKGVRKNWKDNGES